MSRVLAVLGLAVWLLMPAYATVLPQATEGMALVPAGEYRPLYRESELNSVKNPSPGSDFTRRWMRFFSTYTRSPTRYDHQGGRGIKA